MSPLHVKTLVIFILLATCALSYYMPHMNGHYPLPYWASLHNNWPVPFVDQPFLASPYVPSRRVGPGLFDAMKKLLETKRTEVIDRSDERFNQFENDTASTVSSRSRWPSVNRRPVLFDNFNLLQRPIINNNNRNTGFITPQHNDLGRFLYIGAGNVGSGYSGNYLFKTSYVFSSAVATLCVVSTCIPADQFTSGGSTVTCRRKRYLEELLADETIEPSNIERLESTVLPEASSLETVMLYPEATKLESPRHYEAVLSPSFTGIEDQHALDSVPSRQKRFLFIITTTIMTYSFITSTYTYRLTLYSGSSFDGGTAAGLLTCVPSNIGVC